MAAGTGANPGGTAARERVYAEIKAAAATRYPAVTVARIVGEPDRMLIGGSYAVSGAFTRAAWDGTISDGCTSTGLITSSFRPVVHRPRGRAARAA